MTKGRENKQPNPELVELEEEPTTKAFVLKIQDALAAGPQHQETEANVPGFNVALLVPNQHPGVTSLSIQNMM